MDNLNTAEQEYDLSLFNKIFYSSLAAFYIGFPIFIYSKRSVKHPETAWLILPVFLSLGILFLLLLRHKVTVTSDSILHRSFFSTKELPLHAVAGCRIGSKSITIEPTSAEYPRIVINNYIDLSGYSKLREWVKQNFNDINAADLQAAHLQVQEDDAFGNSPENRKQYLMRAKRLVLGYNVAGFIFPLIICFGNTLFSNVFLLIYPFAGICLVFTYKGLVKFFSESTRSIYPGVFFGLAVSSSILLLHSNLYYTMVTLKPVWLPSLFIAGVVSLLLYKKGLNLTMGQTTVQVIFIAVTALLLGFGSARIINCAFDNAAATPYQTTILKHKVVTGKSKTYYITLNPWGPRNKPEEVEISNTLYGALVVGQTVTVQLKPGFMQMPWFWVDKPTGPPPADIEDLH